MYSCECRREFTTPQGLGYHKNYCGKNKISLDQGYEYYIGDDGLAVYIHKEVMEQKLGRKLKPGEIVHHEDENKRNNAPQNLSLTNRSLHGKNHTHNINGLRNSWNDKNGSKNSNSKFTEEQVLEIRERLKNEEVNDIAIEFNVNYSTILHIKQRINWTHI